MANRTLFASGESIGQYTVDQLLGPGHHHIGYRAHDAFGNTCVVKVLLSGRAEDRDVERLAVERTLAVRHGHLAGVHGAVEMPEAMAVVMDYVDGPSLRRWMGAYTPTADETLALFKGVLLGIDALHAEGVHHGALNPGNVLLGPTDAGLVTKVTDFGVARPAHRMSLYAARYLAPERLDGGEPDVTSDLWSLGCVLYELAAGAPPFDGEDLDEIEARARQGRFKPLDAPSITVPPAVDLAVRACLRRNPQARPSDCDELFELMYGNTIVRRISASRATDEQAKEKGTAFASEVGLAVARSLGTGEGRDELGVRPGATVESVARRNYKPRDPAPDEEGLLPTVLGATFLVASMLALMCAGGMLALSVG